MSDNLKVTGKKQPSDVNTRSRAVPTSLIDFVYESFEYDKKRDVTVNIDALAEFCNRHFVSKEVHERFIDASERGIKRWNSLKESFDKLKEENEKLKIDLINEKDRIHFFIEYLEQDLQFLCEHGTTKKLSWEEIKHQIEFRKKEFGIDE